MSTSRQPHFKMFRSLFVQRCANWPGCNIDGVLLVLGAAVGVLRPPYKVHIGWFPFDLSRLPAVRYDNCVSDPLHCRRASCRVSESKEPHYSIVTRARPHSARLPGPRQPIQTRREWHGQQTSRCHWWRFGLQHCRTLLVPWQVKHCGFLDHDHV